MTNPAPRSVVSEAEIEELRKLAEAATPGPWTVRPRRGIAGVDGPNSTVCLIHEGWLPDAAFIAALNPATVLRILADRQAAEALLREACDSRAPDYADAEHPGWARRASAFLSTGKPSKAKETAT